MSHSSQIARHVHYVLRDCSGKIPCYAIAHGDLPSLLRIWKIFQASDAPVFDQRAYLAGFIYETELSQRECGLNEVNELLAGECLELSELMRQFAYGTRGRYAGNALWRLRRCSRQVRDVAQACVDFWASKYDRIVHHLSGGLDSSAILGCLKRSAY